MPPGSARPALVYILFELLTEHDSETTGSKRAQGSADKVYIRVPDGQNPGAHHTIKTVQRKFYFSGKTSPPYHPTNDPAPDPAKRKSVPSL